MTADRLINVIVMITLIVGLNVAFVELAGVSRNVGPLTQATLAPAARKATPFSTRPMVETRPARNVSSLS